MQVLEFMNSHSDWEELLTGAPYNLTIKRDGDYVMLSYSQINSDFNEQICREARGSIFRYDGDKWICVCRAMDKFANYGESYAAQIDWNSALVSEKIDGSLMKVWYDKDEWHLSTNNTIDAFKALLGDTIESFGDLFCKALKEESFHQFTQYLDKSYTYFFELTSPYNQVIVLYEDTRIHVLGARDMRTMLEVPWTHPCFFALMEKGYTFPKVYILTNLDQVVSMASMLDAQREGFVVRDRNFNRIKVKSPAYVAAAHLNNNGVMTKRRAIAIILEGMADDVISLCPWHKELISTGTSKLGALMADMTIASLSMPSALATQKEYAEKALKYPFSGYLFSKRKNVTLTPIDYLKSISIDNVLKLMNWED